MAETLDEMKKKFGSYPVPEKLAQLCDYWDRYPQFFCGSFEVQADVYDGLKEWFRGKEKGTSKILPFGTDGVGSLIGLWIYQEGVSTDEMPVVYLSSEGEGMCIVAENIQEYLCVLGSNRDYIGYDRAYYEYEEENKKESNRYRKWLKEQFNLEWCVDPDEVIRKAKNKFPDFEKWLKSVRE